MFRCEICILFYSNCFVVVVHGILIVLYISWAILHVSTYLYHLQGLLTLNFAKSTWLLILQHNKISIIQYNSREYFNLLILSCKFNNCVNLAKHKVKTPWKWCRCIETCRSTDIQILIFQTRRKFGIKNIHLSLSLSIYIYIYVCVCVCVLYVCWFG
jgi:hypothetical protein